MNMKTLLGTAAGLMVATGAYAADLPGDAAPAAVDYVKVCDAVGAGYFYIPGSETCLKMSGRVRAKVKFESDELVSAAVAATATTYNITYTTGGVTTVVDNVSNATVATDTVSALNTANGGTPYAVAPVAGSAAVDAVYGDKVSFTVDGRVQFSAVTASDLGNIESFFEIKEDGGIKVGDAYISVGYLQIGKFGDVPNGDVFYGDDGHVVSGHDVDLFDDGNLTAQLMASDLGGGFYAGVSVSTLGSGNSDVLSWTNNDAGEDALDYAAAVGIKGQSWGSAEVAFSYEDTTSYVYGVQAKADLKLIDKVDMRLVAAYANFEAADDLTTLAAAVKFAATDSLSVFAGVQNNFYDGSTDDVFEAQFGATYKIASGLELLGEVNYVEAGADNGDDAWTGLIKLTRNW